MLTRITHTILLIVAFFFVATIHAQLSITHYIPPLTAANNTSSIPSDQYMYISTPSTKNVTYRIKKVGLSSTWDIVGVVSNSNPKSESLGSGYGQLFLDPVTISQPFTTRGYIVEASDVIYVSIRVNSADGSQAGALVSKGSSALGTEFRVGSFTNANPPTNLSDYNFLNFASFMATEDNTTVTISNLTGVILENYTGTFPLAPISLNKGGTYTFATNSSKSIANRDGIIGALIKSDKPIVVNCGSANGTFHTSSGSKDYGIDQIVGADRIGKEYIFVKGFGSNGWENVLLVAHYDNTKIYINGSTTAIATKNAGEHYVIEGDKYSANGNMYVETSEDVFAYQGVGGLNNSDSPSEANQGMFFVPPLSCETKGNVDNIAFIDKIGTKVFSGGVSIVTKVGATVKINNNPITATPSPVTGKTDYVTYKVTGLAGTISVQCDNELYCAYFNSNRAATSGSFYSGFPTAPEINSVVDFTTLGNCIPNLTLEAANMNAFDTIEWYYDDGNGGGFKATGISTKTLKPTISGVLSAGTYKLIGTLNCTGLTLESTEIPVSICPDDTDNDGIINDIDIDNDNDGILNCTESYGDNTISLVNLSSGNLTSGSYNYTGTITSNNPSNSLMGANDGSFRSDVSAKNGFIEYSITYKIDFNKDLNLEFKLPSSTPLGGGNLTNEQVFTIQVPNNKTITLLDPDNQLLIDTNFDGVYKSGFTQFSSFKIRFKINGTSLAPSAGTFQFISSMINSFSYTHTNTSETNINTAVFKIKATCLPIDNDNDGITDEFDYDSDNDGIPDRAEGSGTLITLLGTDSNNDGLDDVFSTSVTPIDTDNDTVFDYLDVDSDNDGIFDLEESGSGLTDANSDGIINAISTTIGTNGWADAAETSPDSGIINYTILNTDADALFNYIDSDSDGDICTDVIEAGFTDGNDDKYIDGTGVDLNGKITGSNGYTTPNNSYLIKGLISINQQPINTEVCELTSTKITIVTNAIDSYQWQLSIDGTNWTDISNNAFYTNSTTNQLSISNIPFSFNNNKYRVVLTNANNTCGEISDEITLTVNVLPTANSVSNLELCDNASDGDATNGIVQTFNLESQTSTILGTQAPTNFKVTYHLSQTDANTGNNPQTSPHSNTLNPNQQTIYVRVLNSSGCFVSNLQFNLIVNSLPTANPVIDLVECDNSSNGVSSFNLESQTSTILGTQSPSNFTVTYHLSQADADAGNNTQTSPHSNSLSPYLQKIYVRVLNNTTNCANTTVSFNVVVNKLPFANTVQNIELCDNLDDGNSNNGVVQTFDLESQTSTILGTQSPSNFTVTYHLSQADADAGNNHQTSPHSNSLSPDSQKIYVRVLNTTTLCANTSVSFNVVVNKLPLANTVQNIELCDNLDDGNSTNGIVQTFNLESQTSTILGTQAPTNFKVTYHLSQTDADAGNNPQASPHSNSLSPYLQKIYVRVLNNTTNCAITTVSFNVVVNKLPLANTVQNIELCDNLDDGIGNNGVVQTFDLESQTSTILGTQSSSDYTVTYHLSQTDADAGNNPQASPHENNLSPNNQTIFVRVLNVATGCINTQIAFNLIVNPLPIVSTSVTLTQCDDTSNDGKSFFNLNESNTLIIPNLTTEIISYFTTKTAAESTIPDTNFQISTTDATAYEATDGSYVYARIETTLGGCYLVSEIKLNVEPTQLSASFQSYFEACDDYIDASQDDKDGIATFNFSNVTNQIYTQLNTDATRVTVTYYENEQDALAEINAINPANYRNTNYPMVAPITSHQIYVRIDSNNDNACIGLGPHVNLTVVPLPIAHEVSVSKQCDDDGDGMFPFDTSLVESTVLNGQTNVTVTYFDENNNSLPSPLPILFLTASQTIKIVVSNNTASACSKETSLKFIVDKSPVANSVTIAPACDDESNDGIYDFDTSTIQTTILGGQTGMEVHYFDALGTELSSPLPNPFNSATQTISANVINPLNSTCSATTTIDFVVNPLPDFEVNSTEFLCLTEPTSTITLTVLQGNTAENLDYIWENEDRSTVLSTNKTLDVNTAGNYYITLTKTDGTNCDRTKKITVSNSEIAKITYDNIVVNDDSNNNSISIISLETLGTGNYEFSLTDSEYGYQDEPFFDNLVAGDYTLFVRDKNGCNTSQIAIFIIGFPNFFTPNGDSHNDTWTIFGINKEMYPSTTIYIFNRFGKLIHKMDPNGNGWDGFFNGTQQPSSDYWFSAELIDNKGIKKVKKGHFSLKR